MGSAGTGTNKKLASNQYCCHPPSSCGTGEGRAQIELADTSPIIADLTLLTQQHPHSSSRQHSLPVFV
jgi:hypothetical protein